MYICIYICIYLYIDLHGRTLWDCKLQEPITLTTAVLRRPWGKFVNQNPEAPGSNLMRTQGKFVKGIVTMLFFLAFCWSLDPLCT